MLGLSANTLSIWQVYMKLGIIRAPYWKCTVVAKPHFLRLLWRRPDTDRDSVGRHRHTIARGRSGQSLVEMALVLPLLLTLFFGIFEMGRHFYTRITVRHVVAEATRFAVTGNVLLDANGDPLPRSLSILKILQDRSAHLNVTVDTLFLVPADGGGPEEIVQVNMIYTYHYVMPLMHRFFSSSTHTIQTAMRNEPFYP